MPATPLNVVLFVGVLVVLAAGAVWVATHSGSQADRGVARGGGGVAKSRASVTDAASRHGWTVSVDPAEEFPAGLVPKVTEPRSCEFRVAGSAPRPFVATTWDMAHRQPGSPVATTLLQHRLTVRLDSALPRFAVVAADNWRVMLTVVPEDLVGPGRGLHGLTIYGDDAGVAERLLPLTEVLRSSEAWVVVDGTALTLVREGELDEEGLLQRVDLADAVATALG